MFDRTFESLRKTADSVAKTQQELFKRWASLWPGVTVFPPAFKEPLQFARKWAEIVGELMRKQSESLGNQCSAGLRSVEEAVRLTDAKDPKELSTRAYALWQKSFDSLRKASEAQLRDFQTAVTRCGELVTKGPEDPHE